MNMVIVPDVLRDAIMAILDKLYVNCPDASQDREIHYQICLEYYDEHGELPSVELTRTSR